MTDQEISDARELLAAARRMVDAIEDRGQGTGATEFCVQAFQAARTAMQALCIHYNQDCTQNPNLENMFSMLSPSYLRLPPEVQRAQVLDMYAEERLAARSSGSAESTDCTQAVTLAQNVVSWAEVILAAGKPFIVGSSGT